MSGKQLAAARTKLRTAAQLSYNQTTIRHAPNLLPGEKHPAIGDVQQYLRKYGYLSADSTVETGAYDADTVRAVAKFQRKFQLRESGALDDATRAAMAQSRCGVPDDLDALGFSTIGAWPRRNLSYAFGALSSQVSNQVARAAVERAFATWEAAGVGLSFREVSADPDIFIEWRVANDPDHPMVGGVLAHADFPPGFSVIVTNPPLPLHYDDQEHPWRDGAVVDAFDIETVALHEIGHCLGLLHSDVAGSVMFPSVSSNFTQRALQQDDVNAIQDLYPPQVRFPNWRLLDNNPATRTVAADGGRLYQLHRDGQIWEFTGTPLSGWRLLDNNRDTVDIAAAGGDLYQLHRDGQIWKFTGRPLTGWQHLDNNPDTVGIVADASRLYQLHRDGQIWKYTGVPLTGWQKLDNNPSTKSIQAAGGQLYQLHRDGQIWKYTGTPLTGWQALDRNPSTKSITASGGELYQLHQNGRIWKYTGTPLTGWQELDNNPRTKQIAASGGNLYQIHDNAAIFKYTGTPLTGWLQLDDNPAGASITAGDGQLYQVHANGSIWQFTG